METFSTTTQGSLIIGFGLTLVVAIVLCLSILMLIRRQNRIRFKKRLTAISMASIGGQGAKVSKKGQQRRLLIQGKLDELESDRKKDRERISLQRRLEMAGLSITPKQFYLSSVGLGVIVAFLVLIVKIGLVPALIGGIGVGFGAPRLPQFARERNMAVNITKKNE